MSANGRTRWGYHQLADDWARRLVAGSGVKPGDLVLDVGAGAGAITARLVSAGARVVAFELHERRANLLRDRFANAPVRVVRADAADLRLPRRPFRVVANPPFAVTTALLRRLLARGSRLLTGDLVLPEYVAERWAAGRAPGAGRWHRSFTLEVACTLPRSAFNPPAPMATALLRVRSRQL